MPYSPPSGGGGMSGVSSVNGQTGIVTLGASDVGAPTITEFNDLSDIVETKLTRPLLFFMVGTPEYPTIMSAVTAAELLPEADSTDDPFYQSGIVIFIPSGVYDESVVVKKEINFFGLGGWSTQINQLSFKPFSDTICPQNISIKNLFVSATFLTNEVEGGGSFNPNMGAWSIHFEDCIFFGFPIFQNINEVEFQTCKIYGDVPMTNVPNSQFYNCGNDSTITSTIDDSLPNPPASLITGLNGIQVFNCNLNALTAVKGGGTLDSIVTSINSSITDLNVSPGTQTYVQGGSVTNFNDTGTTILYFNNDSPYTPDDPSKWDGNPVNVEQALDRIAAVVGASTPIP